MFHFLKLGAVGFYVKWSPGLERGFVPWIYIEAEHTYPNLENSCLTHNIIHL